MEDKVEMVRKAVADLTKVVAIGKVITGHYVKCVGNEVTWLGAVIINLITMSLLLISQVQPIPYH